MLETLKIIVSPLAYCINHAFLKSIKENKSVHKNGQMNFSSGHNLII